MQNEHVSFHDKEHDANAMRDALKADSDVASVKDVTLRQQDPNVDFEVSSGQAQAIMKAIEQHPTWSDAKKAEMKRSWIDVSHKLLAGNRVEARRLPRRNVLGSSRDMVRNVADYSSATSNYRAKLDFAKTIGESQAAMQKWRDDRQYDGDTIRRDEAIQEMNRRIYGGLAEQQKNNSTAIQALTAISYLKSMMAPAHMVYHSTHPWMITAPYMAGRHGARAFGALSQAYRDMGAVGAITEGVKALGRQTRALGGAEPTNWLNHFEASFHGKDRADVVKMWKELAETGHIHPEAGMDVHRLDPSNGAAMAALRRLDAWYREATSTTEAINRFSASAAAYRLERLKGATHENAVRYAKDTLANTQGLYSRTNVAPAFRTWMRPFLQFKQFPQMMYHLLGKSLITAFKGETPEVRREALKQFAGIVATHTLMAGAMGLPLEPIRAVAMAANALGVPGTNFQDYEDMATKYLADHLGPGWAQLFMNGVTRAVGGIDSHHSLGLGTLALGLDPRGNSEEDLKAYLFDLIGGAPMGTAYDTFFKGPKEIITGDTLRGLETMSPFKAITNMVKAGAEFAQGTKTARGNQIAPPVSVWDALKQGAGFIPGSVAEANAATGAAKRAQMNLSQGKQAVTQNYLANGDMAGVIRWNQANPTNKISYSGLLKAKKEAALPQALGQKITKANRPLLDSVSQTYNLGGVGAP